MQDTNLLEKYMLERYEEQVSWYDKKSASFKKTFRRLQACQIVLGALVPVGIALDFGVDWSWVKWVTLAISVASAIVTGFIRFFKFEELWKEYRSTCELLRKEKHYFDFKIGDYNDSKFPDKVFVERVESLISSENNKWADINKGSAYSDH